MDKTMAAYMTVEATLVVPFVMYISIIIIYVGFYQYDRCLMRQDAYRAALFGSSVFRADNEEVYHAALDKVMQETEEKYIGTDCTFSIKVQGDTCVTIEGSIRMPFSNLTSLVGKQEWSIKESMCSKCINPVFFIRSCRHILPEKNEDIQK